MEKDLECKIDPILNPEGPNRIITQEIIDALSTVFKDETASCMAKDYAEKLILSLKKGYENQSGEKYDCQEK